MVNNEQWIVLEQTNNLKGPFLSQRNISEFRFHSGPFTRLLLFLVHYCIVFSKRLPAELTPLQGLCWCSTGTCLVPPRPSRPPPPHPAPLVQHCRLGWQHCCVALLIKYCCGEWAPIYLESGIYKQPTSVAIYRLLFLITPTHHPYLDSHFPPLPRRVCCLWHKYSKLNLWNKMWQLGRWY